MVDNLMVQMSAGMPPLGAASDFASVGAGQDSLPVANFGDILQAVVTGLNKAAESLPAGNFNYSDGSTLSLDKAMQQFFGGDGIDNGAGANKKTDSKGNATDALQQMIAQLQASMAQPVFIIVPNQPVSSEAMNTGGMSLNAVSAAALSPDMMGQNIADAAVQNSVSSAQNAANTVAQNTFNSMQDTGSAATNSAQNTADSAVQNISSSAQNSADAEVQNIISSTQNGGNSALQSNVNSAQSRASQNTISSTQNNINAVQNTANTEVQNTVIVTDNTTSAAKNTADTAVQNTVSATQNTINAAQNSANTVVQSTAGSTQNIINATQSTANTAVQNTVISTQNTINAAQSTANTAVQNTVSAEQKVETGVVRNALRLAQSAANAAMDKSDASAVSPADTASQSAGNNRLNAFSEDMKNALDIKEVSITPADDNKPKSGDTANTPVVMAAPVHQTTYAKEAAPVQESLPVSRLNELSEPIMKTLESGSRHLVIKLSPPDMGDIQIKLKMENGVLTADFRVDSAAVKDLFTVAMPHIKNSIEESGVKTGNFFANLKDDSNRDGGKQQQNTNQQQQKQQKEQQTSFFDFFA